MNTLDLSTLQHGASTVIVEFLCQWNDDLPDEDRNRLLTPLLPLVVGTRTTEKDEDTRAWMAADWLLRVHTPAFLRLAGLEVQAIALESADPITNAESVQRVMPALEAARNAVLDVVLSVRDGKGVASLHAAWDSARSASRAAGWDASLYAAWDTARSDVWDTARSASRAAAWDAAFATVLDAAEGTVGALRPTVEALQESAAELVRAMCAVGRDERGGGTSEDVRRENERSSTQRIARRIAGGHFCGTIHADAMAREIVRLLAERDEARAEAARLREDVAEAAGELLLPILEPGTDMSRLMERQRAAGELECWICASVDRSKAAGEGE